MARAAVVASAAIGISLVAHSAAHGATPTLGVLVSGLAVAVLVGINTSTRRYTTGRAFLVLVLLQPVLHLWFVAGAHGNHAIDSTASTASAVPMVLAHIVAALVVAWWIGQGDAVIWQWVSVVWSQIVARSAPVAILLTPSVRKTPTKACSELLLQLCGSLTHRGPPPLHLRPG